MTNFNGNVNCNTCAQPVSCVNNNGIGNYSFILVLFILLIIILGAWI